MTISLLSIALPLLVAAQTQSTVDGCKRSGPRMDEGAWSAVVESIQPRAYFLKSRAENEHCPDETDECIKNTYLVSGDYVLAWARRDKSICVMFTSPKGKITTGRLWTRALDFRGNGRTISTDDWVGRWERASDHFARLSIRRLDISQIEIDGEALWGEDDPERVRNGSVHTGEFGPTQLRVTGYALHFVDSLGNSPPAAPGEYECVVDVQWKHDSLEVKDNFRCGGNNVTFSGTYHRASQ